VAMGESTYDLAALTKLLTRSRELYDEQGVIIRGDAGLSYQDLADFLSVCDSAGIRNVGLPVRPREDATVEATATATARLKTDRLR